MPDDRALRREIALLADLLRQVLREQHGEAVAELVDEIHALARARRQGRSGAEEELVRRIAELDTACLTSLIQALSVFFDLANLAEDRHRVRVLRERERRPASPGAERVDGAILGLKRSGVPAAEVQALLDRLTIDLVFTAHPTEAKRRSIREKVRDLRGHLHELDDGGLSPRDRSRLTRLVLGDLTGLWQTDFVRFRRPSVLEELDRSLFFAKNLWEVTPRLYRDLREALTEHYPEHAFTVPPLLGFGTWIGGDRDGNPNVTAEVTRKALLTLRREALERHIQQARVARRALSVSSLKVGVGAELVSALESTVRRFPAAREAAAHLSEHEPYRRWLRMVEWRLERTAAVELGGEPAEGAYASGTELRDDLRLMQGSLRAHGGERIAEAHLKDWICQAEVFGLHLMRLDVRQESSWYHEVLAELFGALGVDGYAAMDEGERQRVLGEVDPARVAFDESGMSEPARETLALFRLLAATCAASGPEGLGVHIISMTHEPSDVLSVLWLSRWAAAERGLRDGCLPMPIAPLFETIEDLRRAPRTLEAMLKHPGYAAHLRASGGRQVVMIGYSDSTKDGGYLAASWHLYDAQVEIQRAAARRGVDVLFFHGRGGALGRGGGPAARSILSLPRRALAAGLRMTEQGEVLAERYDDPSIAHRHLEQVLSATLSASARDGQEAGSAQEPSSGALRRLAERSREVYLELVEQPGFIAYFEQATPITQIEQLPIGSRPARRRAERSLATLRAIPWVFSWTQSRHMIPAWYGLGTALGEAMRERDGERALAALYRDDPFFRATVDNAALALAKSDMGIAHLHAGLVEEAASREAIWRRVAEEHERSRRAVLALTGRRRLLSDVAWLKRSIERRNPYVDPLSFIQVELFRRLRVAPAGTPEAEELARLIRLTIQGISGGLRTTG